MVLHHTLELFLLCNLYFKLFWFFWSECCDTFEGFSWEATFGPKEFFHFLVCVTYPLVLVRYQWCLVAPHSSFAVFQCFVRQVGIHWWWCTLWIHLTTPCWWMYYDGCPGQGGIGTFPVPCKWNYINTIVSNLEIHSRKIVKIKLQSCNVGIVKTVSC